MIEVERVTKVYARHGTKALDSISFNVPERSVFGFLGPNGAGKTTTIRILATALEPTDGVVRIAGHDLATHALEAKERIGLMPDEVAFYPTLTGQEHLSYYASFYKMPKADARVRSKKLLDDFGLADAAGKKVREYSHGMKKRLALAQCMLHDPEVLIMDEPANGLDPAGMRYFRDLIRLLNGQGRTIFLSSHLLSEVEQLCERVCIIDRGRIVAVDSIANLGGRLASETPSVLHANASGITEEVLRAMAAIPGVTKVERTQAGVDVTARAGSDVSADVSRAIVLGGGSLRELRAERRGLEDLFLSITQGRGA